LNKKQTSLHSILEKLYHKYNKPQLIPPDPLQFVYLYTDPGDMEVVALVSSELAYGRVAQIENSLKDLLSRMGPSPGEFTKCFDEDKREKLRDFKHRFTDGRCISDFLELIGAILRSHGSIEKYFLDRFNSTDEDIVPALSRFSSSLRQMYVQTKGEKLYQGLKYLLPDIGGQSPCKRFNLFLRWMVRDDQVDPGVWDSIPPSKLIVPMDTHMMRLCGFLGLHNRATNSLTTAREVTRNFRRILPDDPVKYDFALSRIGIVEHCTGKLRADCVECELYKYCMQRQTE